MIIGEKSWIFYFHKWRQSILYLLRPDLEFEKEQKTDSYN